MNSRCKESLKLAHIGFKKLGHICCIICGPLCVNTFFDCATSLPTVAHIWFVIFGPYPTFTTWATSGSHPDNDCSVCRIFARQGPDLLWDIWALFGKLNVGHFWLTFILSGPEEGQQCRIIALSGPLPYAIWDPSWREVEEFFKHARSASAPGPSGLPCKVVVPTIIHSAMHRDLAMRDAASIQ